MQLNLKRVLALALAFVLLVGFFPLAARATETDEETASVTVYFSMSHDDAFMEGKNTGEAMALKKITVPYFDIGNYGLEQFYFSSESYGDDGDGLPGSDLEPGTQEFAKNKVTMLHLFIYATEVYYCGIEPEEAGKGYLEEQGILGTDAFHISGSVGSSFLNNLWDYDLNLNYYLNYEYPLASEGWGSTSDQILLHDGDVVTLAHFTSWSFFNDPDSIFNYLTTGDREVETVVKQGESVTLNAMRAGPNVNGDSGTAQTPITTCPEIYIAPADAVPDGDVTEWDMLGAAEADGTFLLDTTNLAAGEYVVAMAGRYGSEITDDICSCPGGTRLIVEADAGSYYEDYPFSNVAADDSTQSLIDVTESTLPQSAFYNAQADVPAYQIIVPDGTETVHVTFNRTDFTTWTMSYDSETGEVGWSAPSVTIQNNGDGTMTVDIPAESFTDNTSYLVLEDNMYYGPLYGFNFVSGTPTVPGGGANKVAVTGVTLDKTTATVDLSDKETSFTLTATVAPENASNKKVTWSSDNEDVASVTNKGIVTAKSVGTANITATTRDGSFTATCKVTVTDVNAPEKDSDGTCLISSAKELKWFADKVNSGSYTLNAKLTADIDLSTVCSETLGSWTPIGCYEMKNGYYAGNFDGQNHTISNLYMKERGNVTSTNTYYRGFFGMCQNSSIKNLNLTGTIDTDHRYVGGLVGSTGYLKGGATVENCHVNVDIHSTLMAFGVGGISGQLRNGSTLKNCSFSGTITAVDRTGVGGIVGEATNIGTNNVEGCLFDGTITSTGASYASYAVGGIVGVSNDKNSIVNCASVGSVKGNGLTIGGIVGGIKNGSIISNCYNAASLTATEGTTVGGIVGTMIRGETVTEENCYYLNTFASSDLGNATAKTAEELKSATTVRALGKSFKLSDGTVNKGFPGLAWQDYKAPELPALPTGDINGDGEIDYTDAAMAYSYYNELATLDADGMNAADVNGDGEVDYVDAALIYAYYNETVDSFPAN